jgi:putative ABC transport system substrate-binding protein
MISRRGFLGGSITLLGWAGAAEAQPPGKIPRVVVLHTGSSSESAAVQREPFERGLRELAWTPGSNIVVEYRFGEGSVERLATSAAELVRQGVDVLVARGNVAAGVAQKATASIPIVMSSADDPVAAGYVKNLARPGGNMTGIANLVSELDGKRAGLLKEVIPGLSRVAVLANAQMWGTRYERVRGQLFDSARSLGLDVQVFEVRSLDDIGGVFTAIDKTRPGALLVIADTIVLEPNRSKIVALAAKHRLPAMYPWHFYTEAGGLMSYATSIPAFHHRSATYVDRILRGAKPADLPVEQPTKFELVINLKTAKALGLTIPPSLRARADQVIE